VRSQQGVELEIIVVDDSPEASARAVVDLLQDPRIRYFVNPTPSGGYPSRVRNLGWPHARGSLIHFLDDDDIIPAGHYERIKSIFGSNPRVGVVFGRIQPFGIAPDSQIADEKRYFSDAAKRAASCGRFGVRWGFMARMLFDRAMLVCGAALARRECVVAVGGFDPRIRLREDIDLYTRIINQYGAIYVDEVYLFYRIGSPSLMHEQSLSEKDLRDLDFGRRSTQSTFLTDFGLARFVLLKLLSIAMSRRR
jgi:glycosyltransferase involved in cell wall biosynthesis